MIEIKISSYGELQHDMYRQAVDYKKPVKRSMRKFKNNKGELIELHPTKGWRKVRGTK